MQTIVLEYLEFTQLSNQSIDKGKWNEVLEYLEFTQLSNIATVILTFGASFRVPGIYTALKHTVGVVADLIGFRVPGIYTALKPLAQQKRCGCVLEYLEFTQLSNRGIPVVPNEGADKILDLI